MKLFYGILTLIICTYQGCYGRILNSIIFEKPGPGGKDDDDPRIVNGTKVQRRDRYPATALLYYRNWYRCGGTIIDEFHIMTAAHCVIYDPNQRFGYFTVAVGKYKLKKDSGSEQYRIVEDVIVHKDYTRDDYDNDLAILRLSKTLEFNRKVLPANLSNSEFDKEAEDMNSCYATGFGVIDDDTQKLANVLQEIKTDIIGKKECVAVADDLYGLGDFIYKTSVCTLDVLGGVCQGDSGGPVGCFNAEGTFVQIGVLSWGSTICVEGFNVFIRVSKYKNWIDNITSRK